MNDVLLKGAIMTLSKHYERAEETEKIILQCAFAATVADMVGGSIPFLAVPATIVSCFGVVWVMYGRLCKELGITLKEHVLKLLAKAALANIAANLGGAIVALVAGMFVPGVSGLASALVAFIAVYLAGYVFLCLIAQMAEVSRDPHSFSDISEKEMKEKLHKTKVTTDDLNAAKRAFDSGKKA